MLTLYGFAASNYYNKVKLALLEKEVPFAEKLVWVDRSPALLEKSPLGKVPFFEIGDKVLFVDIRTRGEIIYTGVAAGVDAYVPIVEHPPNAIWDEKAGRFQLEVNKDFEKETINVLFLFNK